MIRTQILIREPLGFLRLGAGQPCLPISAGCLVSESPLQGDDDGRSDQTVQALPFQGRRGDGRLQAGPAQQRLNPAQEIRLALNEAQFPGGVTVDWSSTVTP